jgi:hypothetical protein
MRILLHVAGIDFNQNCIIFHWFLTDIAGTAKGNNFFQPSVVNISKKRFVWLLRCFGHQSTIYSYEVFHEANNRT